MRNKLMLLCGTALASAALVVPTSAGAIFRPPPPHCDPMACPDPLDDVRDVLTCIALHDGAEITDLPTYCVTRG
jgi:hypothetical protein